MNQEFFEIQYSRIVDRALIDEEFRDRLIKNPRAVLKEYDIEIPENVEVKILENTDDTIYFVLPHREAKKTISRKHWIGEMFDDLFRLTFKDGRHTKTWKEIQEEDKKIYEGE
ncbi:MAG: NHLP leader peptide family natural product precursor [Nitrospirae bacterium]|nr:MAG: NHLP leader peptide family natural product precursor [Nitrospirota bacterium]